MLGDTSNDLLHYMTFTEVKVPPFAGEYQPSLASPNLRKISAENQEESSYILPDLVWRMQGYRIDRLSLSRSRRIGRYSKS
jgi:hypothetical protein